MTNQQSTSNSDKPRNRRLHDVEECQDQSCSDAKTNLKSWRFNKPKTKEPECPLDRESLGRNTWSLLHTIAAKYPKRPTPEQKSDMKDFIRLVSILYPCSWCAKEFREDLVEVPPKVDSQKDLALWFCQMHNKVNKKLNKPQFDCSRVDERWNTGWRDGSCM